MKSRNSMKQMRYSSRLSAAGASNAAKSTSKDGKKLRRVSISDESNEDEMTATTTSAQQQDQGQNLTLTDFLDLQPFDIKAKCPIFSALPERDLEHHPLNADEIDLVQFELEKLLYHVIVRSKQLREVINKTNNNTNRPGSSQTTAKKAAPLRQNVSTGGASAAESSKKSKQKLPESGKRSAPGTNLSALKVKPPKIARYENTAAAGERSAVSPGSSRMCLWPQNQMPYKFVTFVDNFAGPITEQEMDGLKNMVEEYNSLSNPDGSAAQETKNSNNQKHSEGKNVKPLRRTKNGETNSIDEISKKLSTSKSSKSIKSGNKKNKACSESINNSKNEGQFCLGPLTEHLIQALIEESSFRTNFADEFLFSNNNCVSNASSAVSAASSNTKSFAKSLNLGNLVALEQMIKKELEEQGILDCQEGNGLHYNSEKGDEVTSELKQRQLELMALRKSNFEKVKKLIEISEKRIEQQNLEQKLKEADDNIQELCSRFYGVPPVIKRPSTKKEKELLWKAVKERQEALEHLNAYM